MEEPINLNDSGEGTLERPSRHHPLPPPRHESYHIRAGSNEGSGSEIYERLPTDASLGDDMNEPLSPSFPEDRLLSPSDDSDIYSHVDMYNPQNSEQLVKPSDIKSSEKLHQGWVDDSVYHPRSDRDDGMWMSYRQHAFTTGRRHISSLKSRPKGSSQTLKQPGKLNLKDFSLVTETIARMNVGGKEGMVPVSKFTKPGFGHAPLATPENVDLGSEYAQVKDAVYSSYDGEYTYTLVQDAVTCNTKSKLRQRREKERPSYSDSDSDWSSLERRQRSADIYCKVNRKPTPHKRIRKKRAIPVPTPRVPPTQLLGASDGAGLLNYQLQEEQSRGGCDSAEKVHSETASDGSDVSDPDMSSSATQPGQKYHKRANRLKKKSTSLLGRCPPMVPTPPEVQGSSLQHQYSSQFTSNDDVFSPSSKLKMEVPYGVVHDDESSLDMSSPRDVNSPMLGVVQKMKDGDKTARRKEKQKAKADEKQEKRRQKEEKLKKLAEKEKEREKKKAKHKVKTTSIVHQPVLQDFVQSEENSIPLLLEKCVKFIEEEGLDSEGIYRVPGNRAHVDLLFQKFEEDPNLNIRDLDIPVNAVATALKDFFSKRLPPLLTQDMMAELEDISGARRTNKQVSTSYLNLEVITDRSCRLLALRGLLKKLPEVNFEVLKFVFQHFVKISENCKLNSMDSKNLAICWWPTLLPIEFNDMGKFEQMRPHLEDLVQTMIDQFPFLFCGKEAFVMV